jgi:hypothetical protein
MNGAGSAEKQNTFVSTGQVACDGIFPSEPPQRRREAVFGAHLFQQIL